MIQTFPFFSDFSAAIWGLQLNGTVCKLADATIKKFDPENIGVAAGISFVSALELEIPLGGNSTPPPPIAMNVCKSTVAIAGLINLVDLIFCCFNKFDIMAVCNNAKIKVH